MVDPSAGDELLRAEVEPYHVGSRTMSAAMLAWFLVNVWRYEPEDVDDAICDGNGDKGIDALHVDDDLLEITVIQGKWREDPSKTTQGDADLKNLVGAAGYFESADTVQALIASKPNVELRKLIARQNVEEKIAAGNYTVKLVFVTNAGLDSAGDSYVATRESLLPVLTVWDRPQLAEVAERTQRPELREETVVLTAAAPLAEVQLTETERLAVGVIAAKELVRLPGITDHSIFSRNVRLFAGKTRINKQLEGTVQDLTEHRLFPAYHNGLTLLTEKLTVEDNQITLHKVGVVNGCQSLITLNENRASLTDDLLLIVKVVEVLSDSEVADQITYRSNNQNAVSLRDQRSSDAVMRDLQRGVTESFGNKFGFEIRLGEKSRASDVLENSMAAQLIMGIYLREPWAAVRKVRLFDQDYRRIFNRSITPYRLRLLYLINKAIVEVRPELREDLRSSFASIRFTLAFLVSEVVRQSEAGRQLFEEPERWLAKVEDKVLESLIEIANEVVDLVNFHVEDEQELDESYDPKVVFKSKAGVLKLQTEVLRDAKRQEAKDRRKKSADNSYLFTVSPAS